MTESALALASPGNGTMCEECNKIQTEILQYRRFLKQLLDPLTEARFKATIAELERDLKARGCESGKA